MKPIEVTISEVDLSGAKHYHNCQSCIMATALMNRGYNVVGVSWGFARIDSWENEDRWYFEGRLISKHLDYSKLIDKGVIGYYPSIVGTKITLYKEVKDMPGYLTAKAAAENEKEESPESKAKALAQEVN